MRKLQFLLFILFTITVCAQEEQVIMMDIDKSGYFSQSVLMSENNSVHFDTIPSIKYETNVTASGAFTVTVPIDVPKGRSSFQPNLALGYSSQAMNGNVGFGWNIIGLSSISQGGKSKHIDGNNEGPQFNETDPFYLDGERLIQVNENEFNTEKFSKIKIQKLTNNQFSFIVTYTDGKIAKYSSTQTPGQHLISEVTDAFDNKIEYKYIAFNRVTYLTEIKYNGNTINFIYETKQDINIIYRNAFPYSDTKILKEITVKYANGQFYRKYFLTHDLIQENKVERLVKIEVENGDLDRLRPLVFIYNQDVEASDLEFVISPAGYRKPFQVHNYGTTVHKDFEIEAMAIGNFFGQDKLNMVYHVNNGWDDFRLFCPDMGYIRNSTDGEKLYSGKILKNNKITERDQLISLSIEKINTTINNYNYWDKHTVVFRDLHDNTTRTIEFTLEGSYSSNFKDYREFIFQDFNNDGLIDLLIFTNTGPSSSLVHNQNTTSTHLYGIPHQVLFIEIGKAVNNVNEPLVFTELMGPNPNGFNYRKYQQIHTIELDGDGIPEVMLVNCHFTDWTFTVFKLDLNNQSFSPISGNIDRGLPSSHINPINIVFGDFNGDGLTDFMCPGHYFNIKNSSIQSEVNKINTQPLLWKKYTSNGKVYIFEDVDLTEQKIAYILPSQKHITKKSSFWDKFWSGKPDQYLHTEYGSSYVFAMDINNDGKSDLVCIKKFGKIKFDNQGSVFRKITLENINGNTAIYDNVNNITFHVSKTNETGQQSFQKLEQEVDLKNVLMSPYSAFIPTTDYNRLNVYKPGFIIHDPIRNSRKYEFLHENFQEGHITKINDGSSNHLLVEYRQMLKKSKSSNEKPYSARQNNLNFPYYIHQNNASHYLVSKVHQEVSLDIDNINYVTKEYRYENAIQHLDGKGFLGFQKTYISDAYQSQKLNSGEFRPFHTLKPIFWTINTFDPLLDNALVKSTYGSLDENAVFTKSNITFQKFEKPNHQYLILSTKEENFDYLKDAHVNKVFVYDTTGDLLLKKAITNYGNVATEIEEFDYEPEFFDNTKYFFGKLKEIKNTAIRDGVVFTTRTENFFNTDGTLLETQKFGHNTPPIITTYTYFPSGEVESETVETEGMEEPVTTLYEYDTSQRFVRKVTTPDGLFTSRVINFKGWVISETSALGHITTYQHDSWGNILSVTNHLDITSKTKRLLSDYGPPGSYIISQETQHAPITQTVFDNRDLPIEIRTQTLNDQWVYVRKEYDIFGKTIRTSEPFFDGEPIQWNTTEYDDLNRPVKFTTFKGRELTTCYEKLTVTVEDSHRKHSKTLDITGQTVKYTDAGGTIHYTYYPNGSLKETNYEGIKTKIEIDGWGNKTKLNDPSAGIYLYEYDNLSRITKQTNPKGGITQYTYDNLGRLITQTTNSASEFTHIIKNFSYHPVTGLPTTVSGTSNGEQFTYTTFYDNLFRINGKKEETSYLINESYTEYDEIGRVKIVTQKTTLPQNANFITETRVQNEYNNLSILLKQRDITAGNDIWQINSIDARGQVLQMQYGNGYTLTNQFDSSTHNLQQILHQKGDNAPVIHIEYQYDGISGVLKHRNNLMFGKHESFRYDDLDRLLEEKTNGLLIQAYTYDNRGRITSNTDLGEYEYESNSYRLKSIQYNERGLDIQQNRGFAQVQYNAFKNPTELFLENKDRISYDYGILGTRSVAYYGSLDEDKNERPNKKYYSSDKSVEVVIEEEQLRIISYLTGDPYSANYIKIDVLENNNFISKEHYFLHRDNQGTILAITRNDLEGSVVEQRYFDAWGNLKEAIINGNALPANDLGWIPALILDRGYTGHEHLYTVGLIHMNGRIYDSVLRQFMSPDNYVQDVYNTQNYNRYGYVYNNPLLYTDPSGEIIVPILIGAAVAVVAKSISNIINGVPFWYGMGMTVASSIVTGSISFGIGAIANGTLPAVTDRLLHSAAGMLLDQFLPKLSISMGKNYTLSFNMSVMLGHSYGFGLNASLVYDDGNFSYAVGYGITNFTNYNGLGINGWEHRFSGLFGYGGKDFKMSLGTNVWKGLKGLDGESLNQRTGVLGFQSGDFAFSYENDGMPFGIGKKKNGTNMAGDHALLSPRLGDGGDSYRTAAVSLSIGDYSAGFNLFTGKRINYNEKDENGVMKYGKFNERNPNGFVREEGRAYRFGGLYVGYKGLRLGINSDRWVRHPIQDHFAHNFLSTQPGFMSLSNSVSLYFQYRKPNMFTTW